MVIDEKTDSEIISKEEKKYRDIKEDLKKQNENYRTKIELNNAVIKYLEKKIDEIKKIKKI